MADPVEIVSDSSDQEPVHGHCPVTTTRRSLLPEGATLRKGRITRGICVRAPGTQDITGGNSAVVFVGGSNVTPGNDEQSGGVPLIPGASITLPCRDPSKVFVVTPTGTQDVSWVGV